MIINQANLQGLQRGYKVLFLEALGSVTGLWPRIATEAPSTAGEEVYPWLGAFPRVREWVGQRVIQNLSNYQMTIRNRDWELTVGVRRNDIEDDKIGIYNPLFQSMGAAFGAHPDELVFQLLKDGFTQLAYDGQYFFDTDHQDGPAGPIQSNRTNGKLTAARYGAARAAMMSLKDETGRPLGVLPNLLAVAPANDETGRKILNAERLANGEDNPWRGTAELMVVPHLADLPDYWFLMDTNKPVRPTIFQKRKPPQFVAKTNLTDDNVFFEKEFIWGGDARYNAGYAFWQLAYGGTGEVA